MAGVGSCALRRIAAARVYPAADETLTQSGTTAGALIGTNRVQQEGAPRTVCGARGRAALPSGMVGSVGSPPIRIQPSAGCSDPSARAATRKTPRADSICVSKLFSAASAFIPHVVGALSRRAQRVATATSRGPPCLDPASPHGNQPTRAAWRGWRNVEIAWKCCRSLLCHHGISGSAFMTRVHGGSHTT